MIIKTPKVHAPLLIALFVLCIIFALSINKSRLREEAFTIIDTVMTQDWGFSSLTGLYGEERLKEQGRLKGLIKYSPDILMQLPSILHTKIKNFPDRSAIERIDINIKFEQYQKILNDRKRSLEGGVLINPTEVPAKIIYKNKVHKAKVRLKGDLSGHWRSKLRMSLRVALKGSKTIQGFKKFSLHKPGERQYPYDQIFQDFARESDVLAARHTFVRVFVNGQNWGIMNMEEHMSKALLEKQQAKESIIFKLGDERRWYYNATAPSPYYKYRLSDNRLFVSAYEKNKYLSQSLPRAHYSYIAQKMLAGEENDILDPNSFSRAIIAASIWNNIHTLSTANTRFYFNPYTLKIEPITTDQGEFIAIKEDENPLSHFYSNELFKIFKTALTLLAVQEKFDRNVDSVLRAAQKIPAFYDYYHSFFPYNFQTDLKPILQNIEKIKTHIKIPIDDAIAETPTKNDPPTAEQAEHFMDHVHVRHYDNGKLRIFNLLDVPVRLDAISHKGKDLKIEKTIIPPYTQNDGLLVIKTNKTGLHDEDFTIKTSYAGHTRTIKNRKTHVTDLLNPLTAQTDITKTLFIKKRDDGFIIEAGQWIVPKPVTLDGPLTIKAGATLYFAKDAYLIIKGTLTAEGLEKKPITLKPIGEHWKGLYVIEAEEQSTLRYVTIANTNALEDGLLSLTGGVTFYKSPILIENTTITGTIAEDALNIVKSDFTIKNSHISKTISDAFDSDFSHGEIISSSVEEIGGDALDFSGSTVLIKTLTANNIHDKAVSAGEGSDITFQNSTMNNIGVGIASKDGSNVTANQVKISNYGLHAAMTYVKKDMFGPSTLEISSVTTDNDSSSFSRQKGTILTVDGTPVTAEKINVKKLYQTETMRK